MIVAKKLNFGHNTYVITGDDNDVSFLYVDCGRVACSLVDQVVTSSSHHHNHHFDLAQSFAKK